MMETVFDHRHIVFCEDHYNPLGLIRSLGEEGIRPIVILVDKAPVTVDKSRYIGTLHLVGSIEEGYSLLLAKYGAEEPKPFLYSCDDKIESFLDLHYDELNSRFHFFDGGSAGHISKYMDKDAINGLASECGCRIPREETVKYGEFPKTVPYPIITKSRMSIIGGWKSDVFICKDDSELAEAYKSIKASDLLLEEFIEKKNELCLDGFSINGGEEVYIPFQSSYFRVLPSTYGNYLYLDRFVDEDLKAKVQDILRGARFSGIFSVEFLIDKDDDLLFLEVNFRNSTWSYAFTYGGCNLPFNWAVSTLRGHIDESAMTPREGRFTAMAEMNDFGDAVSSGMVPLGRWLKDVKNTDCLLLYNKRDRRPGIATWKRKFGNYFRKVLKRR